jgi:MFS family permease
MMNSYNGVSYVLGVFVADTSSLRNRGFMFAFTSSPYIATVWITGPLSQAFLNGPGWRWCFGAFSIITPVISAPLYALFQYNYWKADKAGLVPKRPASGRTFAQSVWYYVVQFDLFGILLICAGLALFLLPFSLYSYQADGWKSPMIICMIIFGGLLCIAFVIWEKYFAPVTFVPYHLLMDRTVLGACILAAVLFVEFYIWDTYFSSMLQVVYDQNLTTTGYIVNIYSIGSCFWSLVVGLWIRYTGKFKWVALWCGLPLTILGVALMIAFRQPDVNIGYIVMCQIFIAFGGGTLVICEQIAVMAVTSHQYVAVVLAIEGMFSSIGGAIGSAVAAAIWTGVFPGRLERYLPEEEQENLALIVGDITAQMGFPVGTPARDAVNRAYGDAQRYMLISASCVLVIAVAATLVWRNVNVKNFKQVKGTVA